MSTNIATVSRPSLVSTLNTFTPDMQLAWYIGASQKEILSEKSSKVIFVPWLNCYMTPPLAYENSKIIGTFIFDLYAGPISCGGTCLNCHDCLEDCYAQDAQNRRANVIGKRRLNTWLARHMPEFLEKEIIKQLEENPQVEYIRIHSSGDFFAQYYIDLWYRIAKHFPDRRFYFYTKVESLFDFSKLIGLENVNRVKSILPDNSINFGDLEYVLEKAEKFNIQICQYHDPRLMYFDEQKGRKVFKPIHCGKGHCVKCLFNEYMLFFKHGKHEKRY